MSRREFRVTVTNGPRGLVFVPLPFDPDAAWGHKPQHRVHGAINGMGVRGTVEELPGGGFGFRIGPAWREPCGVGPGDEIDVVIEPEGPQRDDLAPDVGAALDANPAAGAFFDGLAQFYRTAYLRWIDATKRSPELRAVRIAEVVDLLQRGVKQRPGT